jgi:methylated-DNA-[protein]-cysteine S-methyltransferase
MPQTSFATPLGLCAIAWNDTDLTSFHLPDSSRPPGDAAPPSVPPPAVQAVIDRVQRHLAGDLQDFSDLTYDFSPHPPFMAEVLRATLDVKAGHTATYGDLATALGQPLAASRAVGRALGANPWPLLIPCHRIVASSGKLTGYSGPGGIATKSRLLALEGAQLL